MPESSAAEVLKEVATLEALVEVLKEVVMLDALVEVLLEVLSEFIGFHNSTAPKTMLKEVF